DAATRLKSLTAMAQLGQHPGAAEVFQAHSEGTGLVNVGFNEPTTIGLIKFGVAPRSPEPLTGVAIRLDRIAQQLHSHNTSNDDVIHEIITRLKTLSSSL